MRRRWLGYRLRRLAGPRIVIGGARISQRGWWCTDREELDVRCCEDWAKLAPRAGVSAILAEHVWEHLDPGEALVAARNCFDFLIPGGYLRVAVPDGLHPDPAYVESVRVAGSGPGADDHRQLFTYVTARSLFAEAGFEVRLYEYFDEDRVFHFREWDPDAGMIRRSSRFDRRNADGRLRYTSIVLDAVKPRSVRA